LKILIIYYKNIWRKSNLWNVRPHTPQPFILELIFNTTGVCPIENKL